MPAVHRWEPKPEDRTLARVHRVAAVVGVLRVPSNAFPDPQDTELAALVFTIVGHRSWAVGHAGVGGCVDRIGRKAVSVISEVDASSCA